MKQKRYIDIRRINFDVETYKLTTNKKKVALLGGFVILCLVTPCTNWLIPLLAKGLNKYAPLWVYR